jgi:hypothetical protein
MSGIPREAWDPNSKKKSIKWNPKGSLGSKLKERRETSGTPREAQDLNSKEEEK